MGHTAQHRRLAGSARIAASKVPEVTLYFWIIKVLTTGMGETASDFLAKDLGPIPAVGIALVAFAAAMWFQIAARRYSAGIYWSAVVMVSVFGTMAADVLHVGLGVPYGISTPFFALALAVVFGLWYRSEGTLSIHSIRTRRRELFYWTTVLATFALGTAAGDMTATSMNLGYFSSGLLFAGLMVLPVVAWRWLGLNEIAAFWAAYILTRPLGASFADWMGVSHKRGGLGWGTGKVTLAWFAVIVVFVAYLAVSRKDVATDEQEVAPDGTPEPVQV